MLPKKCTILDQPPHANANIYIFETNFQSIFTLTQIFSALARTSTPPRGGISRWHSSSHSLWVGSTTSLINESKSASSLSSHWTLYRTWLDKPILSFSPLAWSTNTCLQLWPCTPSLYFDYFIGKHDSYYFSKYESSSTVETLGF